LGLLADDLDESFLIDDLPMNQTSTPASMRHVIAAMVTNEPGVLSQVAGMFAARGFNIDSLVVGRTENPEISRMTIVVNGDDAVLEQVRKQLAKLIPVVKVADYGDVAYVERDLALIQVSTAAAAGDGPSANRGQLVELANLFRAKVIDVGADSLTIELSGTEEKLEAFIELVSPFGIIELARTGVIAMARGSTGSGQRPRVTRYTRKSASQGDPVSEIDPANLPPG
jgi:acetolactate synthase-1/3 small subunit